MADAESKTNKDFWWGGLTHNPETDEYSTEVDMAYGDDESMNEALTAFAAKYGVKGKLIHMMGPGGWPIARMTGSVNAVLTLLEEYHQDDDLKRGWYARSAE